MAKIIISFSTRPSQGSEGGVGWEFLKGALRRSSESGEPLGLIFDQRDDDEVRRGLRLLDGRRLLTPIPVSMPDWASTRYGNSRTRGSYMAWAARARQAASDLTSALGADVVHQVTFATATLPHAMPRFTGAKRVWGPVSVPLAPEYAIGTKPKLRDYGAMWSGRRLAALNVRNVDRIIATNDPSAEFLSARARNTMTEPNVFVDVDRNILHQTDNYLLSTVGLLNDRKRPWLAIEAIAAPALRNYRLQLIGDGPLRGRLLNLARQLGVEDRVLFRGELTHKDTLAAIANSRVLVHPAVREGAAWVIGEAAAVGVPAVVFAGVGAETTVRLSNNGGIACPFDDNPTASLVQGILQIVSADRPLPTDRWSADRIPALLDSWWDFPG